MLRFILFLGLLLPAPTLWALSAVDARHLLVRSGFDENPAAYQAWLPLSREEAVTRLLGQTDTAPALAAPEWTQQAVLGVYNEVQRSGKPRHEVAARVREQHAVWQRELEEWLLANAVLSKNPLAERMTAFWQNHFVSSSGKVKNAQLMYRQYAFLREHALGNFKDLLRGIVRDPAMLIYLDNRQNRKDHPNENLARELLELFSMGEGRYSERDIREAARALSGYSINGDMAFQLRKRLHDYGEKVIFGQRGRFDGDDLIELILQQPATAEFVVAKLWREFISPEPAAKQVKAWAELLREHQYEIRPLLKAIFSSDVFWAQQQRGVLIKSPLQLVVGTARAFSLSTRDYRPWVVAMRRMGQWLMNPPNVKGWAGQANWIDASRWLVRRGFLARQLSTPPARPGTMPTAAGQRSDASAWAVYGAGQAHDTLQQLLLFSAPAEPVRTGASHENTIRHWTLDPVYQLY